MKRMILTAAVLLLTTGTLYAAFTNPASNIKWTSINALKEGGQLDLWLDEAEAYITGSSALSAFKLTPTDTEPSAAEGWFYADDSENILKYYNGSAWVSLGSGTFAGGNITSDCTLSNGVDLMSTTTSGQAATIKVYDNDTGPGYTNVLSWTNGNTPAIAMGSDTSSFALNSTTIDIAAGAVSGVTSLAMGGALSGVTTAGFGGNLTLQNGLVIANSTDTELTFTENSEDLTLDFVNDGIDLKSSTGVATIGWGDLDAFTGLNSLAFDAAASTITLATDGAGDDLTISVTGATDSSLDLRSAGTGADAIKIYATAGGVDIDGSSGGDVSIISTGKSVYVEATEAASDAVVIKASTAGGGIDISSQEDIDITTVGAAGEDITITNTGGSIAITATENDADAITIATSGGGGTSESINILNDQGTDEAAIDIDATAGGIDIDFATGKNMAITGGQLLVTSNESVASAISLVTDTGALETIVITNTQGTDDAAVDIDATAGGIDLDAAKSITITSTEGSSDSIAILSTNGGLDITAATNGAEDLDIITSGATDNHIILTSSGTSDDAITLNATAGGIELDATGDPINIDVAADGAADDLKLTVTGAQDSSIILTSEGTGADAISLQMDGTGGGLAIDTDDGAISIVADGAANGDITIDAQDQITIVSTDADGTGSIYIHADGGANEDIKIHADQGTATDSIELTSDGGGITMNATGAAGAGMVKINSLVCLGVAGAFGAADTHPDVSGSSYWETGGAVTITDFDVGGGTIAEGTILVVKSKHAVTFDVTGSGLTGGTADLVTADGDLTTWIYDGDGNWVLISFTDMSDDLS